MSDIPNIPLTSHHRVEADGVNVFYREAGAADAPVILLLHGFPTSSFRVCRQEPTFDRCDIADSLIEIGPVMLDLRMLG